MGGGVRSRTASKIRWNLSKCMQAVRGKSLDVWENWFPDWENSMCKGPDMGVNLMVLEPHHGGHYGWNRMSEGKVEQFLGGWGAGGLLALKRRWWGLQLLFWVRWEATREYSGFYFYWEAVHINMPLLSCFSRVQLFGRFGLQPTRLLCLWNSSGKNAVVGCHFLPQGSFLTEGWNPDLLCLTCIVRRVLYH